MFRLRLRVSVEHSFYTLDPRTYVILEVIRLVRRTLTGMPGLISHLVSLRDSLPRGERCEGETCERCDADMIAALTFAREAICFLVSRVYVAEIEASQLCALR